MQPTAIYERAEILTLRTNVSQLKNSADVFAKLAMYWSMVLVLKNLNAGKAIKFLSIFFSYYAWKKITKRQVRYRIRMTNVLSQSVLMSGVSGALGRSVRAAATLMEALEAELELKEKILKARMRAAHWNVLNLS